MDQEARYWRDKWLETQRQLDAVKKLLLNKKVLKDKKL